MELYTIHVLCGQRICSYPGEYAPEVLEAIDEYGHDSNPDFMATKLEEHVATKEFVSVRIVNIQVPRSVIEQALSITPVTIPGVVTP